MPQPEKIFANIFDSPKITSLRLSNFGGDAITKFKVANVDGKYTATIDSLTTSQKPFITGLSNIDVSKNDKKGKTRIMNNVKNGFCVFMSSKSGVIADAFGGTNTAAYLAFYPLGLSEYSRATKTQMPILVKRVNAAATQYASQLNATLVAQLQAFETQWDAVLTDQTSVSGSLNDGRAERDNSRITLEKALLSAIHFVAQQYPGDVAKCMSFFDFNLLTGITHVAQSNTPQVTSSQLS